MSYSLKNTGLHNQLLWSLAEEQWNQFAMTVLEM